MRISASILYLKSDGYSGFLFLDKKDMPEVAFHWEKHFEWVLNKSFSFIPAGNEPSECARNLWFLIHFGECREGHNTNVPEGHVVYTDYWQNIPRGKVSA